MRSHLFSRTQVRNPLVLTRNGDDRVLSLAWDSSFHCVPFRKTIVSFRTQVRNLRFSFRVRDSSSPRLSEWQCSVTSFLPQRSNPERSPTCYRVFPPSASISVGAAELALLKQSSPSFFLLPRFVRPDKYGHTCFSMQLVLVREATLHYRSEGFCRSTVIPSEGVSPTRNLTKYI